MTSQILTDNFFQNPAELSQTGALKLVVGNSVFWPKFKFNGTSYGQSGTASSSTNDSLPYLLSAYRVNDVFVVGFNATPSSYGDLQWPKDSIVAHESTKTKVIYYRFAAQASYQINSRLAIGMGVNLEDNQLLEINYMVQNLGNQVSKVSDINGTADIGLLYKLNQKNFITAAFYSGVNNQLGSGKSTLNTLINNQFAMNITQAPVAFLGFQHTLNDQWFVSEKIYWSGWGIQKNLIMSNAATGTLIVPTNWQNAWTLQYSIRYAPSDRIAILSFGEYDTNLINPTFNQIGYPLSSFGSLSLGLDLALKQKFSLQILYAYGTFIQNANICNPNSIGTVSSNIQSGTLQLMYKA